MLGRAVNETCASLSTWQNEQCIASRMGVGRTPRLAAVSSAIPTTNGARCEAGDEARTAMMDDTRVCGGDSMVVEGPKESGVKTKRGRK